VSSNFKISVIEGSRRSTAEMESSNTIDEVMSKIHHKFNIPEDQQRILFAFLRVKHGRARRARCQQQQPLQQRQQQPSKRRRKSPGQGAKVDARPENAAPKATDIVCACTRRRHARASGATLVGRKQSSSPDRKKQKTVQRPSGSHCTGKCKTDAIAFGAEVGSEKPLRIFSPCVCVCVCVCGYVCVEQQCNNSIFIISGL
jgi:hypothetical protein